MLKKAVQQGRGRVRIESVPHGYVEDFDELGTKLADFFRHPVSESQYPIARFSFARLAVDNVNSACTSMREGTKMSCGKQYRGSES